MLIKLFFDLLTIFEDGDITDEECRELRGQKDESFTLQERKVFVPIITEPAILHESPGSLVLPLSLLSIINHQYTISNH